jgi:hypothetical protein
VSVLSNAYAKVGDLSGTVVRDTDSNNAQVNTRILPGQNYDATPRVQLTVRQPISSVGPAPGVFDFTGAFATFRERSTELGSCPSTVILNDGNDQPLNPQSPVPPGTNVKINLAQGQNVLTI